MYEYKAIKNVLEQNNNVAMTVEEIAKEINKRGLYRKRDGSKVDSWCVGARALNDAFKSKAPMFDVLIRLR